MTERPDYIIVGQGIAGTILTHTLLKKGRSAIVIDEPRLSACSQIAAGNINPIVFKRLVKSWKADSVIPFAFKFYKEAETFLQTDFFSEREVLKIFSEEQEKNFWQKKCFEEPNYLSSSLIHDIGNKAFEISEAAGLVKQAANINTRSFLEGFRKYLSKQHCLVEEQFDFANLKTVSNQVEYKKIIAKKIIFCEGWKAMWNPFFSYLPFQPAKGEMLIVRITDLELKDKILHKGIFISPLGNHLFNVGATYDWEQLNDEPTEKAREMLLEKLDKLLKTSYEIVEQVAGVRPSVKDRRPLIGQHPQHPRLGIFNGMGTKGLMLAPYFAHQYVQYLENDEPLDTEVDIHRYLHFYN